MASDIEVTVKSHLKEIDGEVEAKLITALEACGEVAISYAKAMTPVKTGRLRSSITKEVDKDNFELIIGTNVHYGKYIENGSSKYKKPKHMLKRALSEHKSQYEYIISDVLNTLNSK